MTQMTRVMMIFRLVPPRYVTLYIICILYMSRFNVGSIHCSLHMMKWGLILHYVMGCLAPALWPLMACYSNWLVHVGMEVSNTAKVHNTKQGYEFS